MTNKKILIVFLLLLTIFISYAQDSSSKDTYTTVNIMIKDVTQCKLGYIIRYYSDNKLRELYLPYKFFDDRTAIKIPEESSRITPQMNVIFKNKEAFRVKIYMPLNPIGYAYKVLQFVPPKVEEQFNNTDKLKVLLYDTESSPE